MYDVMIIGAGVSGCAIARELSRYQLKIGVLEKEEDVCCGTSKANSGIVHAGFDAKPGTMKAKMNVEGNAMMGDLARELDFSFERIGSLVLCFSEEDLVSVQNVEMCISSLIGFGWGYEQIKGFIEQNSVRKIA